MKITLFLPVRNEICGIQEIMPKIKKEWVDEIIVVDGHSTDGTKEYFLERGYQVIDQTSIGICGAYWDCFAHATGDIIISFSPDGNSLPELIPILAEKMKQGYDMVIASRYMNGAKSEDDDPITALGNWMFTKMVNVFFGGNYTDVLVMLRAFRKDLIERLSLDEKVHPVLEMQLNIRCAKKKMKVLEIPGTEPKRIGDTRKMKPLYNGSTLVYLILKELFKYR